MHVHNGIDRLIYLSVSLNFKGAIFFRDESRSAKIADTKNGDNTPKKKTKIAYTFKKIK